MGVVQPFPSLVESREPWGPKAWLLALTLYVGFALATFYIHGPQPSLGPDHVSYFELADSIAEARPDGDYWREANSVRTHGVILAYLHPLTGSHVLSMKIVLAVFTVLYLLAAQLFFNLFARGRTEAVLFALLSAFAVSFGISSWGVTDTTALLNRTLGLPVVMFSLWFYFRFYDRPERHLAYSFLVVGSLLHLSCFYAMGLLIALELWDFAFNRRFRVDIRLAQFTGGLAVAATLLYWFERTGISIGVYHMILGQLFHESIALPASIGAGSTVLANPVTLTSSEAWAIELAVRPWRNMPLPLVNVANVLSSYVGILVLALAGLVAAKRAGFTRLDRAMAALFGIVPIVAFIPQTLVWALRSVTSIYPITFEEVRTIGFIMVPSLYFAFRLFQRVTGPETRAPVAFGSVILVTLVGFPLAVKSLTVPTREAAFELMATIGVIDRTNAASVENARSALGISHDAPFFYSMQGVLVWLQDNTPPHTTIISDRDELVLLRDRNILGPRQFAAVPTVHNAERPDHTRIFLKVRKALRERDAEAIQSLGRAWGVDYAVVPWRAKDAVYADDYFSVIRLTANRADHARVTGFAE
jgi:hypothetical protein